ncbi:hypothetical protein CROQUDRAFT_651182 [Cronartium quercuum f. sp. fusiforme G11]|uniref:Uncharacterized protein n=1 Tax=Cronartium quercuum f. sp. fusiforme G11 TaxID=708437 RepID=A0A9P6NSV8_9BASI|nr:hypothetical protein CROQUDRAFT_651182 [Cronartium quercuum f. sp. fusiforme G11]
MIFATFLVFGFGWLLLPAFLHPSAQSGSNLVSPGVVCQNEYASHSSCNEAPCSGKCVSRRPLTVPQSTALGVQCQLDQITATCPVKPCSNPLMNVECASYKQKSSTLYRCQDKNKVHYLCQDIKYKVVCDTCAPKARLSSERF